MADARATLENMLAMGDGGDSISEFLKSSFEQLGLVSLGLGARVG